MPCQPAHAHRDLGRKPSGMRVYCLSLGFSQSTLDDLGHNQGGPSPAVWAACPQSVPIQGRQILSHTEFRTRAVVATWSSVVLLLPQCSRAPTERHDSPAEAVLSGSEVALPGLIEILKYPDVGHRY